METKLFRNRLRQIAPVALTAAMLSTPSLGRTIAVPPPPGPPPKVQVALLLDTSSSMNGLINQAKAELWSVVNRMSKAHKGNVATTVEVALYEYGKSSIPAGEGYLRMISPLTTDLDGISEKLFALTTNGGQEYAGMVIQNATEGLAWSANRGDYKAIFIAGNEPFTQGPIGYQHAIATAVGRGIVVNTIHCGNESAGVNGKWAHGASLGRGTFLTINHNASTIQIATPYDAEIQKLSAKINSTYVGYGKDGKRKMARQRTQDANAATMGASSGVARAVTKSGGAYKNSQWDLVDAESEGAVSVEDMDEAALPAEMKPMNKSQRKAYVAGKSKERKRLQAKVAKLAKKRDLYLKKQRKASASEATLDKAMLNAIGTQMRRQGYEFAQ